MGNDVYDPDEIVKDSDVFELVPVGWYTVRVKETKYVSTDERPAGCGMVATYVIDDGDYNGRYLWDRFYPQTRPGVQILQKTLKLAGVIKESMTGKQYNDQLQKLAATFEGKRLMVKVGRGSYQGEPTAEVKGYKPTKQAARVEVGEEVDVA